MALWDYLDPIVWKWHTDTDGEKVSMKITGEQRVVTDSKFVLEQVPDKWNKVTFNDIAMYEIDILEEITQTNEFKVDYVMGIVYVHSSLEGKAVSVNYYGRGYWRIPMSRIYDELNADGSIKNTLDIFINSIIPWGYKGVYNNSTGYIMNNSVLYNGTTYICIAPISVGHLPTETNFWRPLSSGLFFKGDYDGNTQYYERDIVYYNSTKALYICLSKPSINTIPTNTTYWQLLFQFTEFDYDANIPSLFVAIDNSITIAHNLNSYPLPHVVSTTGSSYGH
jgi:hypothetical protein